MPSYKLIWHGTREALERISMIVAELFDPMADAVSLTKKDAIEEDADTPWTLEAYYADAPDTDSLVAFLKQHDVDETPDVEELPDIDWVAHALEGLGIVNCGRFVLYGIHDADKLPDGDAIVPIRIDANQAFGTGHHPTTAGCLEVLDKIEDLSPRNILDLGTGSAVLAIAARKIWDGKIMATDIDAKSVEIAAENAALNQVSDIRFVTAAGFDHNEIGEAAPFDFIFANILAGPLAELAPGMADHTEQGATVVLAGLLARQEADVMTAYEVNGFSLKDRHAHETWPVLIFEKN